MAKQQSTARIEAKGFALKVRVTPRARKNQVTGLQEDGTVKIRLTAPPVEGRANQLLIEFLAAILEIPSRQVEIIAGAGSRNKLVNVQGLDPEIVKNRLLKTISKSSADYPSAIGKF